VRIADDAIEIALEHLRWCQRDRKSIHALLVEIGHRGPLAGADDLAAAVARAWLGVAYAGAHSDPNRAQAPPRQPCVNRNGHSTGDAAYEAN
jgi:hypothetical protein